MLLKRSGLFLALGWVGVCGGAMIAPVSAQETVTAQAVSPISLPKVEFRKRVLANGLTVLSVQNKRTPTVAIQVWYKVGSRDDPSGRSGFAHLFEHLLFKSTRNMKSEMLDRLTEDVGGENNAFTSEDVTVYHETVPSNYLHTLLWAEADRMVNLNVDEANFKSERAVVQEEYRQSVLAPPYGRLSVLVNERSFVNHPYKRDTIGSIADLQAATLGDVRAFYKAYYRPDNATVVVVGDFDPQQLDTFVDQTFGRITKPDTPLARNQTKEPARTAERRFNVTAPGVPLPAVHVNFLVGGRTGKEAAALQVADVILSGGESSRLYRSLVYGDIASEATSRTDLRADAGLFQFEAVAASNKPLDQVEQSLIAQVEALKTTPPTQAELMKARNQLLSSTLNARETNEGLALALGEAAVYQNDPQRVNTEIAELLAVTGEDIQRVARQFFTLQNRLVVRYQSGGDALKGGSLRSPQISNAPALPPVTVNPATKGSKQTPPAPGKPRSATLPTPTEMRLTSGLRVVVISAPGSGLVTAQVTVLSGGASDPKELPGLADFTASLLTRGTQARTAPQIAEQIEALGGSLSSSAGWDSSNVSLSVLSTNLPQALPILADVVRNPAFAPDEINRLRTQSVDDLQVRLQEPGTLARYVAAQLTFGSGPYAHPLGGTVTSLKRVSRNDITRFYTNYYRPDNSVLVIGGDIAPSTAFAEAERVFGNWAVSSPPPDLPKRGAGAQTGRVVVIDKPDAGQAAVVLSRPGLARSAPHYYVGAVANSVFGGGYSSRLNQEVRIKRGLSYGAFSNLDARLLTGPFVASVQTKNESADEVATLLQSELARLGSGTLSSQELETRKAALSGNYARSLETGAGLVATVSGLLERGIAPGAIQEYLPKVQQVTSEQVRAFAARRLSPQTANLVIAGNASKFLPALRKRYKNVQVIRAAKLNLDQNNLAK